MGIALFLLGAATVLAPATLRLEFKLEPVEPAGSQRLQVEWRTRAASGRIARLLTPADTALLERFSQAVATPGSEWESLSQRVAELLLGGIEPAGSVRNLVIALPAAPAWLRRLPFETLGRQDLLRRFGVWYEDTAVPPGAPLALANLWEPPPETVARFEQVYRNKVSKQGLAPLEALRESRRSIFESSRHPAAWAAFVLRGPDSYEHSPASAKPLVNRWLWLLGFGLLAASAAFLLWGRPS